MSSAIDYPRHIRALATKSRANLKISRVSARDTCASVKCELICTVYWCFNTLNHNWCSSGKILTPCDVKWVVGQDVYTVIIATEIIVCKIQAKATFGDGNMAIINIIWSDSDTYVVMVNGILHHHILMDITNEGLVFCYKF